MTESREPPDARAILNNELVAALQSLSRFTLRLGEAYIAASPDARTLARSIRNLAKQETEAGMVGVGNKPLRQSLFDIADYLEEFARTEPGQRNRVRPPKLYGQAHDEGFNRRR